MDDLYAHTWNYAQVKEAKTLKGPILILGASGFIGAKFFFTLKQYRDDVFGCSKNILSSWRFENYQRIGLENIDITNLAELEESLWRIRPKTIFNLSSYGGHSHQTNTEMIHQVNYSGALNILKTVRNMKCEAFVQAGSSSEYGSNSAGPTEEDDLVPNSDYSVSKIRAYYLVNYYGQVLNLPAIHLRLYSIYGPWQERKTLIPVLISHCLENKWPPLVDKNISHDFVYIDDCTNAFVKAALLLYDKECFGRAINIASGTKTTTKNLTKKAATIFHVTSEPQFGSMPNRSWDLPNWYGNPELAAKLLNWKVRTSLKDGLTRTAEWEKEFKKTV